MINNFSLAVISVVFNSLDPLRKTIDSFNKQQYRSDFNVHYFVVDGLSSDGTQAFLETLSNITYISEPDNGIFDAMNKGALLASSNNFTHCLFLNSGDTFCDDSVIARIFDFVDVIQCSMISRSIFIGDTIFTGFSKAQRLQKAFPPRHIYAGMPFCHQSVLMPSGLIVKWNFDLRYRCSSDYEWFCRSFVRCDNWVYLDFPVSTFFEDGLTASKSGSDNAIRESSQIRIRILNVNPIRSSFLVILQKTLFKFRSISPAIVFLFRTAYHRLTR